MSDTATTDQSTGTGDGDKATGSTGADDTETDTPTIEELQAERDAAKADARKWEQRAKGNAKANRELEDLKRKGMEPDERALEEARAQGRIEAAKAAGQRLAAAELKAAGVPKALIEDLNMDRFLDDDGDVDDKAVERFKAKYDDSAPAGKKAADLKQGARGSAKDNSGTDMNERLRSRMR